MTYINCTVSTLYSNERSIDKTNYLAMNEKFILEHPHGKAYGNTYH